MITEAVNTEQDGGRWWMVSCPPKWKRVHKQGAITRHVIWVGVQSRRQDTRTIWDRSNSTDGRDSFESRATLTSTKTRVIDRGLIPNAYDTNSPGRHRHRHHPLPSPYKRGPSCNPLFIIITPHITHTNHNTNNHHVLRPERQQQRLEQHRPPRPGRLQLLQPDLHRFRRL